MPLVNQTMRMTRRKFLGYAGAAGATLATGYSLWEARDLRVTPFTLPVSRLPQAFSGLRAAVLADLHHGPFISLDYIRKAVDKTNALGADLILLLGDYVYREAQYIPGVMEVMGRFKAPMGVYAVKGNHDNYASAVVTSQELRRNGLMELTNTGVWLQKRGDRLRLCGVEDLLTGRPNVDLALGNTGANESALLLSHNPDLAEKITGSRVGLVISGHTHGGQVCLPFIGAPVVPSRYGQKYVYGPAMAPFTRVFTTRGVGTIFPPIRIHCPPEISLLTLVPAMERITQESGSQPEPAPPGDTV